jgi:hypothetical protein
MTTMKKFGYMLALLAGALWGSLFSNGLAVAADVALKDNYPSEYTVKRGDTLWDISSMYLRDPWLWPEIWQVNPQVSNPHLIYPGDRLKLIYVGGKPRLVVARGDVKLTPHMRVSPLDTALSAIPADVISPFLSGSRVVEKGVLDDAPYVLAGADHKILGGAGDKIYGRGEFLADQNFYGIYRKGQEFKDPETNEHLGVQALEIGTGVIKARDDGKKDKQIATTQLNQTNEEVRVGDRYLPLASEELPAVFYPKPPAGEVEGVIIAVEGGVGNIGRYDVVTLNLGERENIQIGDVLSVHTAGERVNDPFRLGSVRLPGERAGLLMIFKVFEKVSYGLVLESEKPLAVLDTVENP